MVAPFSAAAPSFAGRCFVERCTPLPLAKLPRARFAVPVLILLAAAGCSRTGEIEGYGITSIRSPCPHVEVPAGTGDVTLFDPPASLDAKAIDVTAVLTNVQSTCDNSGEQVATSITFDVQASRMKAEGARDVTLPYFVTLVRGGSAVVSKSVGHVTVHFEPGQLRTTATATANTQVARAAATLSKEVRDRLNKKRKAGNEDAAVDPLSDPGVRSAVLSATFEAMVGFQLTQDQLKYNVTR